MTTVERQHPPPILGPEAHGQGLVRWFLWTLRGKPPGWALNQPSASTIMGMSAHTPSSYRDTVMGSPSTPILDDLVSARLDVQRSSSK